MRFVYRNRKLALFGMFFLFGAMMILIKFTEFSPTCLFREETAQPGPMMVRDQVRHIHTYILSHRFKSQSPFAISHLWFIRKVQAFGAHSHVLCALVVLLRSDSIRFCSFCVVVFLLYFTEIHTRKRQTLLSVPSTDAIDFHWWCTTIRYDINASNAWCTSRRSVSMLEWKQVDFSIWCIFLSFSLFVCACVWIGRFCCVFT